MITEYSLEGVRTYQINLIPDERGFFGEVLRQDWKGFIDEQVVQANLSYSYPGMIRAWHRHERGQIDYFLVLKGALKICAFDEKTKRLVEIVANEARSIMVRIPGHYYHGTKTISSEPSLTLYFVNKLYDYKDPDEIRLPWNDPGIVPAEINGNTSDKRVNRVWDWFYPAHR